MLPTSKEASLILNQFNGLQLSSPIGDKYNQGRKQKIELSNHAYQHLYITSEDEIKSGDWFINTTLKGEDRKPYQADKQDVEVSLINKKGYCKKIIATTYSMLCLPQPSFRFIKEYIREYNKVNSITEVIVEYEIKQHFESDKYKRKNPLNGVWYEHKLKIDTEYNAINVKRLKESWNREEITNVLKSYREFVRKNRATLTDLKKWISENI